MKDIKVKCSVGQFLVRIFLSEIYGGSFGNAFFFSIRPIDECCISLDRYNRNSACLY